ncbi:MAG: MarR family winged helix-turn-helix transcriptional regulator [Coriobacteriia bacterium]|nr:MarR family winged helix-turn-helix transcriptional regulator [Coriobacteriia bacterium]
MSTELSSFLQKDSLLLYRQLAAIVHGTAAPSCKQHALTAHQLFILIELKVNPGQTVMQLCENTGVQHTNFALTCKKMEARNLIVKERSTQDRRSFTLRLTDEGSALVDCINQEIKDRIEPILQQVPQQLVDETHTGVAALAQLLEYFPDAAKKPRAGSGIPSRRARARQLEQGA